MSLIYIFWSCKDKIEAKKIIHLLLEEKLIACASIFPEVESIYRWQGNVEESQETKVILKTAALHFKAVREQIQKMCSYEVPEIVQVNIADGNPDYLAWVREEVKER